MRKKGAVRGVFYELHPGVSFSYFALALIFTMFFTHPVCLIISFLCAALYAALLCGGKALLRRMLFIAPIMLFTSLLNPLFNHSGATILAYFPDGNPLTLESIVYGAFAAVMMGSAVMWFICFNAVMDSDRIICLFGRIMPSVSLVITITLRFIPIYLRRMRDTWDVQSCAHREGGRGAKLRMAFTVVSSVTSWALESGIETADSMKARLYGSGRRTSYSLYRFDVRDGIYSVVFAFTGGLFAVLAACGYASWQYFPVFSVSCSGGSIFAFASLLIFYLIPTFAEIKEALKWRSLNLET